MSDSLMTEQGAEIQYTGYSIPEYSRVQVLTCSNTDHLWQFILHSTRHD